MENKRLEGIINYLFFQNGIEMLLTFDFTLLNLVHVVRKCNFNKYVKCAVKRVKVKVHRNKQFVLFMGVPD